MIILEWKPKTFICSTLEPRINVNDYKKDFKMDFINGRLAPSETVSGIDAFIQKFIRVLLANKTPIINYGLLELLPKSNVQAEFDKECEKLSSAIVTHKFSDSTEADPNGIGYTVEEVHGITRKKINEINYLLVSVKATGTSNELVIEVPLNLIQSYLQKP